MQVFEREGQIHDVLETGEVQWIPDGIFIPWTSPLENIEFFPPRFVKGRSKSGKTSQADLKEIRLRIPDLQVAMAPKELTLFDQLVLGEWVIWRDILRDFPCESLQVFPHLLCPQVVHQFRAADSEKVKEQAEKLVEAHWKKHAVLGVPITCGAHWTLLVLRRGGSSDLHSKEFVKVVYYDSLATPSAKCKAIAQKFLDFLLPDSQVPGSACRTLQDDAFSCGQFLLHYWEGEVRQFLGQGWCVGRPTKSRVLSIRGKMIQISKELEEFIEKDAAKDKKKGAKVEVPKAGPLLPRAADMLEHLAEQAKLSGLAALQIFYGCSRCRYSRSGCINYNCNPVKFEAHLAKFPEKYEGKRLKPQAKVTQEELHG